MQSKAGSKSAKAAQAGEGASTGKDGAAADTPSASDAAAADATPAPQAATDMGEPDAAEPPAQDLSENSSEAKTDDLADATEETQAPAAPQALEENAGDDAKSADAADQSAAPVAVATVQGAPEQSGGFFPALLGGVIAAGLGFGAAYVWLDAPAGDRAALEALREDVTALQSAKPASVDTSALEQGLAEAQDLAGDASAQIAALSDRTAALEARLAQLESSGVSSSLSPEAVKAYEAELQALQTSMAEQRAALDAAAAAAAQAEASAEDSAKSTLARAALARVQAALDSGSAFAPALADLAEAGVEAPAALGALAQEGAPTLATLRAGYPAAARAALAQARKDAGPDAGGGLTGFLKAQLGARSLAPREGDDADAILSRAEAALDAGRLNDTMAELASLPEAARAVMGDWLSQAQARLDAVAAADALAQDLNQN
ncbi:hypothetical protein NBRC116596_14310 [Litorivita sp. NS0012-18]